eukprot:5481304-Karenia_brevis.AAC.1
MADGHQVALGGFEVGATGTLFDCRWYYLCVDQSLLPIVYSKGRDQAYRYIATLELLGTLCGLVAFTLDSPG